MKKIIFITGGVALSFIIEAQQQNSTFTINWKSDIRFLEHYQHPTEGL
jgi:hypothetical protein